MENIIVREANKAAKRVVHFVFVKANLQWVQGRNVEVGYLHVKSTPYGLFFFSAFARKQMQQVIIDKAARLAALLQHDWIDKMCFPYLQHLFAVCLCSLLWAFGGVGAESKVWRMDWYSSQTGGLLLKAPFKPNVNRPLKSACRSLLNGQPTMWEGLLNHWLPWSQARWHSLEMLSVFECLSFWWITVGWKMGSRFYLKHSYFETGTEEQKQQKLNQWGIRRG